MHNQIAEAGPASTEASITGEAVGVSKLSQQPILLVHGAWHSAFHWQRLVESLGKLGRQAMAVDLPGQGMNARPSSEHTSDDPDAFADEVSCAAGVGTEQCAEAVVAALRALPQGSRPILVAHSVSGTVATRAAEIAPELIARLVYLAAFVPVEFKSPLTYMQLPEFQTGYGSDLFIGNPEKIGVVRINPRGDDDYLELLRLGYYHDVPFDDFLPFARALTSDLPIGILIGEVEVTVERWGRVPRTYIRCTNDRALAPAVQTMMIEGADRLSPGNPTQVIDIATSHSPFASDPERLAQILADLIVLST